MMKKLAILSCFLFVCSGVWSEQYFQSNALGLPIREIKGFRIDEFLYVLTIDEEDNLTIKTLMMDGKEYKRWELEFVEDLLVTETVYLEGAISETRQYNVGSLTEEVLYDGGAITEKRVYDYSSGFLKEVRAVDGEGTALYTDVYERSAAGRLRRIHRSSGEDIEESGFIYSKGELVQEWHGKDDEGILFRYHNGEKLAEETWEGLKLLLAEEVRMFDGKKEIVIEDAILGITTTKYYDDEDRVKIERRETADDLLEHIRYDYEGEKVAEKTRISRAAKEDWRYAYDSDGEVIRETLVRNTWTVKVIEHTGEGEYFEEIYRDGLPALRVYFKDGTKVDEEFLGDQAER
jgi:YD repeat-containing protein